MATTPENMANELRLQAKSVLRAGDDIAANVMDEAAAMIESLERHIQMHAGDCLSLQTEINDLRDMYETRIESLSRAPSDEELREAFAVIAVRYAMFSDGHVSTAEAQKYLEDCRDKEHFGDCTKAPIACLRCSCDDAYKQADDCMAALRRVSRPVQDIAYGE